MPATEAPPTEAPWPTAIHLHKADRVLEVEFSTGERFRLDAEFLRVESPSAEVKGHGSADRPPPVAGKINVAVTNLEQVGNYAVRILFDDGHDTGLYSWDYLYKIGRERDRLWGAYLKRLEAHGLSRDN